ncbi:MULTISPECIES: VanW family protein [unclassified Luteococcus]|uniref:VanW family protein n=1 Tax=unclassified Luteococcus TaxID=2639923 RepID=UPI00313AA4B9
MTVTESSAPEPTEPNQQGIEQPEQPGKKGRGGRLAALGLGSLALLAVGVYGAGYAMAGDKLPRNASVEGVAVGGMDEAQATAKLTEQLKQRATAPITLAADKKQVTVKPAEAGLAVDYPATIEQAGAGKSLNPSHIWNVLRGGGEMDLVKRVDDATLKRAVEAQAKTFAVQPVDAKVALQREKITVTDGVVGTALDVDAASAAVKKTWLQGTSVGAPITRTEPQLTTEEAKTFAEKDLKPRVSAPLLLDVGKPKKVELTGPGIGELTTISTKDGNFVATPNLDKLFKAAERKAEPLGLKAPQDAKWQLSGGKPTLVPGKPGEGIDRKAFDKLVPAAMTKTGAERTITMPVTKKEPEHTTEEAKKAAPTKVTGEFTTSFPHADYRNTNLGIAAQRVNNTYIAPGETFSMNDTIGPRDAGSGFVDGWVVSGDHLKKENAGGISQSGTTVFNALFFSGLEHVEHQPHTMYFDRYPAGREATLYYGSIDVKFKNDTPYGAIMQAYVNPSSPGEKGSITVKVWSTPVYDKVESTALEKSNFTTGRKLERSGSQCHDQAAAPGFTVNYARLFYKGGKVVKREPYSWTYSPTDEIVCK